MMDKKVFLIVGLFLLISTSLRAQNLNLDEYDVLLNDTLISKADFLKNGKSLDSTRARLLTFNPIKDGQRKVYYLNGQLQGQGEIKNKKEDGFWTFWHENGQKAREGEFNQGKRTGTHTYWYPNGNLRGTGNFKNDKYDGKWTMYKEDGSEQVESFYRDGELVK